MITKVCKRCGVEKPIEEFRHYYAGRKGTYSFCKLCERIEQRRKYIMRKGTAATSDELEELNKINTLYAKRSEDGLQIPSKRKAGGVSDIVDTLLTEIKRT